MLRGSSAALCNMLPNTITLTLRGSSMPLTCWRVRVRVSVRLRVVSSM